MKEKIKILSELTKIRITIFVTLTAIFGYICFSPKLSLNLLFALIGVLLVSSGSAAINHSQEHKTDALMQRTKNRPIPSQRITVRNALIISIFLVVVGSSFLLLNGILPLVLGLLNIFWYNVIYTPLKKISQIAIIPGSLVGAIPPAVGWTSAGGYILDPQIIVITFFFFIWQIPHFWLLLLVLNKDYEQAGFPTLTQLFNLNQLSRITFIWIIATAVASLLIPFFGIVKNPIIYLLLLFAGIWLTITASKFLKNENEKMNFRAAFRSINLFILLIMVIISFDLFLF